MQHEDVEFSELQVTDLELVRNWRNSPEVARYMYTSDPISEEDQQKWFKQISTDPTQQYWLIVFRGEKIGLVSLYNMSQRFKRCSWAFYLGQPGGRGQKIGSKVEFKLIEYVFTQLQLNKLTAEVFTFNEAVIGMHEKFGFRREGYLRQHILKEGVYYDVVALALLKQEWEAVREHNFIRIFGTETTFNNN